MKKDGFIRTISSLTRQLAGPLVAVLLALVVSGVLIWTIGKNPVRAFATMWEGSLGSIDSLATTGVRATPLLLCGLSVALSFRIGVFNIGAEGQLYLGAVAATIVGLLPFSVPAWLHITLALMAGFIAGAMLGAIPGYLRAYRNVNEVVVNLMLNYIVTYFVGYLVNVDYGPLGERGAAYAQSPLLASSSHLPILVKGTSLHLGLILGLFLAVALHILINNTPFGFQVRMIGSNPNAARYAGVPVERNIVKTMLLSGGLAGLAGASEIMGLTYRLFDNFSPGYGFDGIAVALLARNNPLGVILSSAFYGALRAGAGRMQQILGIQVSFVNIIMALTILFAVGSSVFTPKIQLHGFKATKQRKEVIKC
jgi:ABC-type uncharacterized transport system permease subunit